LNMNEYTIYTFTNKNQAATETGPFGFYLTGLFGSTPPTMLTQDVIQQEGPNTLVGQWEPYAFKKGTMASFTFVLPDVGNIQSLTLENSQVLTKSVINADPLSAWKIDQIWVVDHSRSQIYTFNPVDTSSGKSSITFTPKIRSKEFDILIRSGPPSPLDDFSLFGMFTLIGTTNQYKYYFVTGSPSFSPSYTYDFQVNVNEYTDVYLITITQAPDIGRVIYFRGQLQYNNNEIGKPLYHFGPVQINYYRETTIATGNATAVYSSGQTENWSPIYPVVYALHNTVPKVNQFCLAYPDDDKCKDPLSA